MCVCVCVCVCVHQCGQCGVNDVLLGMKSVIMSMCSFRTLKNVPSFDCTLDVYHILQNVTLTGYKLCLDS